MTSTAGSPTPSGKRVGRATERGYSASGPASGCVGARPPPRAARDGARHAVTVLLREARARHRPGSSLVDGTDGPRPRLAPEALKSASASRTRCERSSMVRRSTTTAARCSTTLTSSSILLDERLPIQLGVIGLNLLDSRARSPTARCSRSLAARRICASRASASMRVAPGRGAPTRDPRSRSSSCIPSYVIDQARRAAREALAFYAAAGGVNALTEAAGISELAVHADPRWQRRGARRAARGMGHRPDRVGRAIRGGREARSVAGSRGPRHRALPVLARSAPTT